MKKKEMTLRRWLYENHEYLLRKFDNECSEISEIRELRQNSIPIAKLDGMKEELVKALEDLIEGTELYSEDTEDYVANTNPKVIVEAIADYLERELKISAEKHRYNTEYHANMILNIRDAVAYTDRLQLLENQIRAEAEEKINQLYEGSKAVYNNIASRI